MISKPEHITDLESGAIVAATVRLGNEGDTKELTDRVLAAGSTLARVCDDPKQEKVLQSLTADEGCSSVEESCGLQGEHIRAIIGDPRAAKRRKENQSPIIKQVLHKARRAVKSASAKALLRKRGQFIERSFAHVLDQGGLRRTTLRGKSNLTKRQLAAALAFELSLIMRKLTCCGIPKQWLAEAHWALFALMGCLVWALSLYRDSNAACRMSFRPFQPNPTTSGPGSVWIMRQLESGCLSFVC